jgi:hypothetical protein
MRSEPDDMRDVHGGIINSNAEVVDRLSIAAKHHKVSQCVFAP